MFIDWIGNHPRNVVWQFRLQGTIFKNIPYIQKASSIHGIKWLISFFSVLLPERFVRSCDISHSDITVYILPYLTARCTFGPRLPGVSRESIHLQLHRSSGTWEFYSFGRHQHNAIVVVFLQTSYRIWFYNLFSVAMNYSSYCMFIQ